MNTKELYMTMYGSKERTKFKYLTGFWAAGFAVVVALSSVGDVFSASGVIFETTWDTATGAATNAVTDGGRWPNYWEFGSGGLMSVVAGGPNGHNALRVQQRGATYAANIQVNDVLPATTDVYLRYYFKNDDTSGAGDHVVQFDTWALDNMEFMRKDSAGADWSFVIGVYGCGYTYPIGYWRPKGRLAHGTWYRIEYFVHYVDATHLQVHPRVYDTNGTLLFADADFQQSDYGTATWNGSSTWTLASYYAGNNSFCVNPNAAVGAGGHALRNFEVGNNGQQGAADTGLYWYFAAIQIRSDTWPGPVPGVGATPPSAPTGLTIVGR
jgi:hypothetical protein